MLPNEIIMRAIMSSYRLCDAKKYEMSYVGERYVSKYGERTLEWFIDTIKKEIKRFYGKDILTDKDFLYLINKCYALSDGEGSQIYEGRYYTEMFGTATLGILISSIQEAILLFSPITGHYNSLDITKNQKAVV